MRWISYVNVDLQHYSEQILIRQFCVIMLLLRLGTMGAIEHGIEEDKETCSAEDGVFVKHALECEAVQVGIAVGWIWTIHCYEHGQFLLCYLFITLPCF